MYLSRINGFAAQLAAIIIALFLVAGPALAGEPDPDGPLMTELNRLLEEKPWKDRRGSGRTFFETPSGEIEGLITWSQTINGQIVVRGHDSTGWIHNHVLEGERGLGPIRPKVQPDAVITDSYGNRVGEIWVD